MSSCLPVVPSGGIPIGWDMYKKWEREGGAKGRALTSASMLCSVFYPGSKQSSRRKLAVQCCKTDIEWNQESCSLEKTPHNLQSSCACIGTVDFLLMLMCTY